MSDERKLAERMCPNCSGELVEGMFFPHQGGAMLNALLCKTCDRVFEEPK